MTQGLNFAVLPYSIITRDDSSSLTNRLQQFPASKDKQKARVDIPGEKGTPKIRAFSLLCQSTGVAVPCC